MVLKALLLGVVLPAAVAGGVWGLAISLGRLRSSTPLLLGGGALALGGGYIAGHWALLGRPPFPPVQARDWLAYFAVACILVGWVEALPRSPLGLRWLVRLLFSAAFLILLLLPMARHSWTKPQSLLWLGGLTLTLLLFWAALDGLARRLSGRMLAFLGLMVAGASAGVLLFSRSAMLGQLAGVLAAALGASWGVSWWAPHLSLARGAVAVMAPLLMGLWLGGYFYAQMPLPSALLLLVALPLGWVGELKALNRLAPWQRLSFLLLAVLLPLALALAFAFRASQASGY